MNFTHVLVGAFIVIGLASGGWLALLVKSASAAPTETAPQLLRTALSNALLAKSVHAIGLDTQSDGSAIASSTDAGRTVGIQQITYEKSHNAGHLTDVVNGKVAYFRGDSFSLSNFFGFTALIAAHIAGQWVSVASSNKAYPLVAADLTLSSTIDNLQVPGVFSTSTSTLSFAQSRVVHGERQLAIVGRSTSSGSTTMITLYVRGTNLSCP